mgnify:CR=1 FL=1
MTNKTRGIKGSLNNHRSPEIKERKRLVMELHEAGLSAGEITRRTGIPNSSVLRHIPSTDKKTAIAANIQTMNERRKKVLELNHLYKSRPEIAKVIGCSIVEVGNDLRYLKKDPNNKVNNAKEMELYRLKQKAALPEPDKYIECESCEGHGVDVGNEECFDCLGKGAKDSFYGNIVKEPVLVTRNSHITRIGYLMKYLGLTDWQELLTWYKHPSRTQEQNKLYFERKVGDGFVVEELNKKRKNKTITQRGIISGIQAGYESNRVTDLPWKQIREKIRPPEGRKPEREIDAYNMDQIKILYNNSNPTYKALIAFFMSGLRLGGGYQFISGIDRIRYPEKERFPRIKDLTDPLEGLTDRERQDFLLKIPEYNQNPVYRMNIYSEDLNKKGDPDHYACWSTPEFYYLINLVLAKRQKDGELDLIDPELKTKPFNIKYFPPESPIFRAEYGKDDVTSPRPLSFNSMKHYLGKRRKDFLEPMKKRVKLFNGFRSYVQSVLEHEIKPKISPTEIEWLMGRELPKMGEHYDKWKEIERLMEFWKALEWLTIGPMREKFLNQTIEDKDEQIKQEKQERQRQADEMYGISAMTKQALQDSQETRNLMRKFMSVLTPEEIGKIQERISSSSSLPSESKKMLIDVTKSKIEDAEGEEHT